MTHHWTARLRTAFLAVVAASSLTAMVIQPALAFPLRYDGAVLSGPALLDEDGEADEAIVDEDSDDQGADEDDAHERADSDDDDWDDDDSDGDDGDHDGNSDDDSEGDDDD